MLRYFLLAVVSLLFVSLIQPEVPVKPTPKPNIVLIMVDDMGWSDIGCYGGEIPTPNLDRLAQGGLRFKQFYNTGRCCPTRASLLTGLYPHQAGIGQMAEDPGTARGLSLGYPRLPGVPQPPAVLPWPKC